MNRNFTELVESRWLQGKHLCVGLDLDLERLPNSHAGSSALVRFGCEVVDATTQHAGAYKPNMAFYEALGPDGIDALQKIIRYIHVTAPEIPVIIDAKRADIANTNNGYVTMAFDYLAGDAITVHPYLGHEAIRPFLDCKDKGIFILCRTSNPGAGEIQDLAIDGEPLYLRLARLVSDEWNYNRNCGLVVGATYPRELQLVRERTGQIPLLIPGVGAQGGEIDSTVRFAASENMLRALINVSRAILFGTHDDNDLGVASIARRATIYADDIEASRRTLSELESGR